MSCRLVLGRENGLGIVSLSVLRSSVGAAVIVGVVDVWTVVVATNFPRATGGGSCVADHVAVSSLSELFSSLRTARIRGVGVCFGPGLLCCRLALWAGSRDWSVGDVGVRGLVLAGMVRVSGGAAASGAKPFLKNFPLESRGCVFAFSLAFSRIISSACSDGLGRALAGFGTAAGSAGALRLESEDRRLGWNGSSSSSSGSSMSEKFSGSGRLCPTGGIEISSYFWVRPGLLFDDRGGFSRGGVPVTSCCRVLVGILAPSLLLVVQLVYVGDGDRLAVGSTTIW